MRAAVLLALIGLAFSSPLTSKYKYEANVAVHDSKNPEMMAGTRLSAQLLTTVAEDKASVNIKISDVKTCASMEMKHAPAGRTPISCSPKSLPSSDQADWITQLEKTFTVVFTSNGERLMVPENETLWITNLRKGIVSTLRVPYVLSLPGGPRGEVQTPYSFDRTEETIHGSCLVRYTMSEKMDDREKGQTKLVKSIDVSACTSQVTLTKASQGNMTEAGYDQFRGVSARASLGTYTLAGVGSGRLSATVHSAVIEGSVVLHNVDTTQRASVAVTNQTLSLVQTTEEVLVPKPSSTLKPEIWSFRVLSDHHQAQDSPQWVTFLNKDMRSPMNPIKNGLGIDPASISTLKYEFLATITDVWYRIQAPNTAGDRAIANTSDLAVLQDMRNIVELLRMIPTDVQKELLDDCHSPLSRLQVLQAMMSSGSAASFQVLIELLKENKLSSLEILEIFSSINVGAYDPVMVGDLIDWATQYLPTNIDIQAGVLINLSTLVRRICVERSVNDFIFPRDMFGSDQCTTKVDAYVNFLKKKLEESKQQNKQHTMAICMQALANVGNQECMAVLATYAKNEVAGAAARVFQLHAINGMTKNHLLNSSHEYVRGVLLSIIEAEKYETEVRQAAVVSLFTLPQNASMWHRVAMSTWYEPNLSVARFIYSYVKSVSESQNPYYFKHIDAARTALVLAKPFNLTASDAQYYAYSNYHVKPNLGFEFELVNALKQSSQNPELIKSKFILFMSGLKYPVFHLSSVGKQIPSGISESVKAMFAGLFDPQMMNAPWFGEAKSRLQNSKDIQQIWHSTFMKDIEFLIPLTGDYIEEVLRPQSILGQAIASIKSNNPMETSYYTKLSENNIFVPTDLGIPVTIKMEEDIMIYFSQQGEHLTESHGNTVNGDFMGKIMKGNRFEIQVLAPWENKRIAAGFEQGFSAMIPPTYLIASLDNSKPETTVWNYEFGARSSPPQGYPVMVVNWLPFVAMKEWVPTKPSQDCIQVLAKEPVRTERFQLTPASLVNINVEIIGNDLCGQDFTSLWTLDIDDLYSNEAWEVLINYTPPQQAERFAGKFLYASKPDEAPVQQITGAEPMIPNLNIQDTVEQRLQKMTESPAKQMLSASLQLMNAGANKKFELINLWSHQWNAPVKKLNHQMVMIRSGSPQQNQMCVSSEVKLPTSRGAVGSQLPMEAAPAEATSQIYTGPCQKSAHAMTLKAKAEISPERQRLIQASSAEPVYDLLNMELEKMKGSPSKIAAIKATIVNKIIDYGHYSLYPSFETPSLQGSPSKIASIKATRSPRDGRIALRMQSRRGVSGMAGLKVPYWLE